ncbi:MAG: phosphodiester glycosidase family protein [Clostridia bacterium]|nr:phosphodiester glycosidase family protein [Clostridia bacterium]
MKRVLVLALAFALLCSSALAELGGEVSYTPLPWDAEKSPYAPKQENYLPDLAGYSDSTIDIRVEHRVLEDVPIIVCYIKLADASQIRTGTMGKFPSKAVRNVHRQTRQLNAVAAINGDWFINHTEGIVYRNGEQLRFRPNKNRDTLIIDQRGDLHILAPTPAEGNRDQQAQWWENYCAENDIVPIHTFCFGPGLVVNGEINPNINVDKVGNKPTYRNKRMAIGQDGPLSYVIICCNGPADNPTSGVTLRPVAELFIELGCSNAYNLDGGGSATLVLDDKTLLSRVREVADFIWFATLEE